jgi:hypothetical protein
MRGFPAGDSSIARMDLVRAGVAVRSVVPAGGRLLATGDPGAFFARWFLLAVAGVPGGLAIGDRRPRRRDSEPEDRTLA